LIAICSVLLVMVSASPAVAANTVVNATIFPAVTVPGGTVTIHTTQGSSVTQPVKVTVSVANPGSCVVGKIPTFVGSLQMNLKPGVLRNDTISLTTPAAACAGTYTVKVNVVNTSTNTTLASHTATFSISPGQH
jgi:hypothetical protein